MKINISYFGHYSFLALKDNIDMMKNCLQDCGHEVTVSNLLVEGVNFVYEGHHPDNYNKVIEKLKNRKNIKILICTEELTSNKYLPKSFYTFNHHRINFLKYKNKKFKYFYALLILNFKFQILNFFTKHNLETKLKKYISNFDIKKKLDISDEEILWKDRYDFFLKNINYYDGYISTYDKYNYEDLKLKSFLFLPHLFSKVDLNYNQDNLENKNIDILFTGQMNKYRENFLEVLKKKFKVKILNIATDEERSFFIKEAKIIIGLFKNKYQPLSSASRTYDCIRKRSFLLSQKPLIKDHLDNEDYLFEVNDIEKKLSNVLLNYKYSKIEFVKYCDYIIKKFQAEKYKSIINTFLDKFK